MNTESQGGCRHFLTYSGVKLPFKLVTPLDAHEVKNRNTYFKFYFAEADDCDDSSGGRLLGFDKMVYGEVELAHRYAYHDNGALARVEITDIDGEASVLAFDSVGRRL